MMIMSDGITGKPYVYEEDFIKKYKDSEDSDIQLLINGLIESYLGGLVSKMIKFAYNLVTLMSGGYSEKGYYLLVDRIFDLNISIDLAYDESVNKENMWEFIDNDIEYYWREKILSKSEFAKVFPEKLENILKDNYISTIIREGETKCKNYYKN